MSAEERVSENAQVAEGHEGENPQVASGGTSDTPDPDAQGQKGVALPSDEKGPIPYDRFEEVNQAKNAAEQELAQLRQVFYQQQQQPSQQKPQGDPFQAFLDKEGIGQDGFISRDDLAKVYQFTQQQAAQTAQQQQQQQWFASHPDYVGVAVTSTGQASDHLLKAIKNDPVLGMKLQQQWDPILAYNAALAAKSQEAPAPNKTPSSLGDQIRSGQRAPQGISAAQGSGGSMDKSTQIQSMSDDEFAKAWTNGQIQKGFSTRAP